MVAGRGATGAQGPRGHRGPVNRLAVIGYLILTVAVAGSFWQIEQNRTAATAQVNEINVAQCASLRNLYAVIRKTLADGDKAIDRIDYYRTHPAERAEAHARNRETISRFREPPCPPNIRLEE